MTKKHFQMLANELKAQRPSENWDANKLTQWDMDVRAVARVCDQMNPRFDVDRFIKACGGLFNSDISVYA